MRLVQPEMLATALIEDLNRLACPGEQERYGAEPARARNELERLRFIDTSELDRFAREGWLDRDETDLIERFLAFARERLAAIPGDVDAVTWTQANPGWQMVRERALELVDGLDARIDIGVPGWQR